MRGQKRQKRQKRVEGPGSPARCHNCCTLKYKYEAFPHNLTFCASFEQNWSAVLVNLASVNWGINVLS